MTQKKKKVSKNSVLPEFSGAPVGRRAPLGRAQVVAAALKLLDAEGLKGLTMRRLGARLQIQAASLYNHVHNKEALLALVAEALCEEMGGPPAGLPWDATLEAIAWRCRDVMLRHRDGARVMAMTPPSGPHRLSLIEIVLSTLLRAGFTPADAIDAGAVHNAYVVGFVLNEDMGGDDAAGRAQVRQWFAALPADRYPTLVAHAGTLAVSSGERRFRMGLEALLEGLRRRLAA